MAFLAPVAVSSHQNGKWGDVHPPRAPRGKGTSRGGRGAGTMEPLLRAVQDHPVQRHTQSPCPGEGLLGAGRWVTSASLAGELEWYCCHGVGCTALSDRSTLRGVDAGLHRAADAKCWKVTPDKARALYNFLANRATQHTPSLGVNTNESPQWVHRMQWTRRCQDIWQVV